MEVCLPRGFFWMMATPVFVAVWWIFKAIISTVFERFFGLKSGV